MNENYIDILREDEIKKVNECNEKYITKHGFEIPTEDIALSISTYDKINQSGFRNYLPALLGDSYLQTALYEVLIEDYQVYDKGKLNLYGQNYWSRKTQSKYVLDSGMADCIIVGKSTNLYITKKSPNTLHSIFENIIYMIHKYYGIEGVKQFIRKANYL